MATTIRLSVHLALAAGLVCLAIFLIPLARLGACQPILWALAAHEHHLGRALAIARGEL